MESHQRVSTTRWWSFWPGMRAEGGWGRFRWNWEAESHQRVIETRWWSFWAESRSEGSGNPPTSRDDSLVVIHSL